MLNKVIIKFSFKLLLKKRGIILEIIGRFLFINYEFQ